MNLVKRLQTKETSHVRDYRDESIKREGWIITFQHKSGGIHQYKSGNENVYTHRTSDKSVKYVKSFSQSSNKEVSKNSHTSERTHLSEGLVVINHTKITSRSQTTRQPFTSSGSSIILKTNQQSRHTLKSIWKVRRITPLRLTRTHTRRLVYSCWKSGGSLSHYGFSDNNRHRKRTRKIEESIKRTTVSLLSWWSGEN